MVRSMRTPAMVATVDDTRKIAAALVAAGGRLVADATLTPWQSLTPESMLRPGSS